MKAPALPGLSCSTDAMIGHRSVTVRSWTRIPVFVLGPRAEVAGVGLDRFILEVGRVQEVLRRQGEEAEQQQRRDRGQPTVPMTLDDERATNPFLRCAVAGVRNSAMTRCGTELGSPGEVFAEIRSWKDTFR